MWHLTSQKCCQVRGSEGVKKLLTHWLMMAYDNLINSTVTLRIELLLKVFDADSYIYPMELLHSPLPPHVIIKRSFNHYGGPI